jgi:hypothetical protein
MQKHSVSLCRRMRRHRPQNDCKPQTERIENTVLQFRWTKLHEDQLAAGYGPRSENALLSSLHLVRRWQLFDFRDALIAQLGVVRVCAQAQDDTGWSLGAASRPQLLLARHVAVRYARVLAHDRHMGDHIDGRDVAGNDAQSARTRTHTQPSTAGSQATRRQGSPGASTSTRSAAHAARGTHPPCFFRIAFTTSLTPRLTFFSFAAARAHTRRRGHNTAAAAGTHSRRHEPSDTARRTARARGRQRGRVLHFLTSFSSFLLSFSPASAAK